MSKIICDVCGSAYSDTASQCPICGTAKRDNTPIATEGTETVKTDTGYTYVKGGRFSHSNVRKHNSGKQLRRVPAEKTENASAMPPLTPARDKQPPRTNPEKPVQPKAEPKPVIPNPERKPATRKEQSPERNDKRTNLILMLVVAILLLAVIFVGVYIVLNWHDMFPHVTEPGSTENTSHVTGGVRIPCIGITVPALETVESDGTPVKLNFEFTPSNTTDEKIFASGNPEIATVDQEGSLTVLASGEVTITVTCGDQTVELVLNCVYNDPAATDPTKPPLPEGKLELVKDDVTFSQYGAEYQLYKGEIDASLITFTSSDEKVVTVDATGKIKIVGNGTVTITAVYGTQTAQCIVRCSKVTVPTVSAYKLNFSKEDPLKADITINVGERQTLQLINKETGEPVTGLTWYTSMNGYVSLNTTSTGVRVTGTDVTKGVKGVEYVRVMCDYEGITYTCIVRVRESKPPAKPEA